MPADIPNESMSVAIKTKDQATEPNHFKF